jgi:hypothetical protein
MAAENLMRPQNSPSSVQAAEKGNPMKKIILTFAAVAAMSTSAFAAGDPSSLKVKVYAVYASTSALCTSPTQVFLNNTGEYVDFLSGPTLGGGDLPDGTYNCIIIKMSDIIKHTPKVSDGTSCVAATEYTGGVCKSPTTVDSLTGTADIACLGNGGNAGAVDTTVFMYLTTGSTATGGNNAFKRPVTAGDTNGIKLGAPLTISSTTRAKFVVNGAGQVQSGNGECGINAPTFTFVNL